MTQRTLISDGWPTYADIAKIVKPIRWHWPGWIAGGLLHLLAAEGIQDASGLALRIAASYILGWPWPDGTPHRGPPGAVAWAEAEGDYPMHIERAEQWGIPLDRCLSPLRPDPLFSAFSLHDITARASFQGMMQAPDVRIGIVHTLRAATVGMGKARRLDSIRWLAELARDVGKPILLAHPVARSAARERPPRITLDRLGDVTDILPLAKIVWALDGPHPDDREARRISVIKNGLGGIPGPVWFLLDG